MLWPYSMRQKCCGFGSANSSDMCFYSHKALYVMPVMLIFTWKPSPYNPSYAGDLKFKSRSRDRVSGLKFS